MEYNGYLPMARTRWHNGSDSNQSFKLSGEKVFVGSKSFFFCVYTMKSHNKK